MNLPPLQPLTRAAAVPSLRSARVIAKIVRPISMKAYYFTTAHWGIDDVLRKRIKVSQLLDLNDPFELLGPELSTETLQIAFSRSLSEWNELFGIICLCTDF